MVDFTIKYKDESLLMKVISYILFFNKDFMTNYITTIGSIIYFPTKEEYESNPTSSKATVLHELVHIMDYNKYKLLFSLSYLAPQVFALLAIPLVFVSWYFLFFLLFLAPIPAYFRYYFEKRAYTITIYSINKLHKDLPTARLYQLASDIVENFTGSNYYFMWPFKSSLQKYFYSIVEQVSNGEQPFLEPEIYKEIDSQINN